MAENFKKKRTISTRYAIFLLSGIAAALLFAFGVLLYEIKITGAEASRLLLVIEEQASVEREFLKLKEIFKETAENRVKLGHYFITSDEVVDFIEQIESLARHTNTVLEFNSVSVAEDKERKTLDISFNIKGAFTDAFYFLRLIEELPFRISVKQVHLNTRVSDEGLSTEWTGTFSLSLLSFVGE